MEGKAKIGILRWEEGKVEKGLLQLEELPGNSTNPDSYPFPVEMVHVPGACMDTILRHPDPVIKQRMIDAAKEMQSHGVKAVFGSCGFNAIWQKDMAAALDISVCMSAILQVPFVQQTIGPDRKVLVVTANAGALTEEHFESCGVYRDRCNYVVAGLEKCPEWNKQYDSPDIPYDMEYLEKEILDAVAGAAKSDPAIGAIVIECTDLPPYQQKIAEVTGLPVYSINTMIGYAALMLGEIKMF